MEQPRGIPGLLVVVGIVALGIVTGAAYFHYKAPRLKERFERELAAQPTTPEGRILVWHEIGAPQIHHRVSVVGRFSTERPWLITHAKQLAPEGDEVELWGIDCEALPVPITHVDGMTVVIELPSPAPLGRLVLSEEHLRYVPVYGADTPAPDPAERLATLALHLLERMPEALAEDIPGASIEVRVGTGWEPGAADGERPN